MYDALDIAKYVINRSHDIDRPISNLKLQKILYFIQGNFYLVLGKKCFNQSIHAWDYGPVIPEVYREFKCFGSNCIPYIKTVTDFDLDTFKVTEIPFDFKFKTEEEKEIVDGVVELCKNRTASNLVSITHSQFPWKNAYREGQDNIISENDIERYFTNEAA